MKKSYKKRINPISLAVIISIVCVSLVTIGYSVFQASVDITNMAAIIRIQENIRITNVTTSSPVSDAVSYWEEFGASNISSGIDLPYSDSSITYDVTVTNIGNVEMALSSINNLPSNLNYSISDYVLDEPLCDDANNNFCKLGSVTTLHVTISYATNGYDSDNTQYTIDMAFLFNQVHFVARIGSTYYTSLQKAVNAVPSNNSETMVILLSNTTERIDVSAGKNIIFDFGNYTINSTGTGTGNPIIETAGKVRMSSGTLISTAGQGAVNVKTSSNNKGVFIMTGGSIVATGSRQAIYNNGGTVDISGTAYLSNTTSERGTIQNVATGGTIIISGGTVVASNNAAVVNEAGVLIIGNKNGIAVTNSPIIMGATYGVLNGKIADNTITDFSFYDGVIKGRTDSIYDKTAIIDKETNYNMNESTEVISGATYNTAYYGSIPIVTFDPNGGGIRESQRSVAVGNPVGELPIPTKIDSIFVGWFTEDNRLIDDTELIYDDVTFYAHWSAGTTSYTVRIGNAGYDTLNEAINDIPENAGTQTEVLLLQDIVLTQTVTISASKNIYLNMGNHTVSGTRLDMIINYGTLDIRNGTITSSGATTDHYAVDNRSTGTLNITGGLISSIGSTNAIANTGIIYMTNGMLTCSAQAAAVNNNTGGTMVVSGGTIKTTNATKSQAVYNDGGSLTISGSAYLESKSTNRATVHNNKGTVVITGGTIIAIGNYSAVLNADIMTIGTNDNTVDITSPVLQGKTYGLEINSGKTVTVYDGIFKGETSGINNISRTIHDNNYTFNTSGTEGNYKLAYLN